MESPETDDLAELRMENAVLKRRNAQLVADTRMLSTAPSPILPWWKSNATIITLTAIVAAVVPLTSAVHGWVQTNRELALEEAKFKTANALELQRQANAVAIQRERRTEDIRTSYLERVKTPAEHLRALRFVLAMTEDKPLRTWAMEEKKVVEDELQKVEDEARRAPEALAKVHRVVEPAARPQVTASQPLTQDADKADAPRVVTSKLDELKERSQAGQPRAPAQKAHKTVETVTKPQVDTAKLQEANEQEREADNPLRKPKEWERQYPGF
jgi:hypothetical protein